MQIQFAHLKSKVAKRILLLFVIAAIIPVALTGVIAYKHVTTLLTEQKKQHLLAASKAYGMSIFDRIVVADDQFKALESSIFYPGSIYSSYINTPLSIQNTNAPLFDDIKIIAIPESIKNKDWLHLSKGKTIITTDVYDDNVEISYTRLLTGDDKSYLLYAILDNSYIFGDMDVFAGEVDACVVVRGVGTLNCSNKSLNNLSLPSYERYIDAGENNNAININGLELIVSSWELFLNGNYNSDSWHIYYTVPGNVITSPIASFAKVLGPLLALAILLMSLISVSQISKILIPLEILISATKNISKRDFSKNVSFESNDEFQKLGESFNQMSSELENQFTVMGAMANLDQTILSTMDRHKVVDAIFYNLNDFIKYNYAGLIFLNESTPERGELYTYKNSEHNEIILNANETDRLFNGNDKFIRTVDHTKLEAIEWLNEIKSPYFTFIAVKKDIKLLGIIVIGHEYIPRIEKESLEHLTNYTDRVNVALQAIRREEKLVKQANFDSLTKLPNRQLLIKTFNSFINDESFAYTKLAVLFIDLDKFKAINDSQGHATGDKLLIEVGERINSCIPKDGSVYRYGGDEFIALIPFNGGKELVTDVAYEIIEVLSEIFTINSYEQFIGASIGIATYPEDGSNWNEILQKSDIAMYKAKQKGRGRYMFFSHAMQDDILEKANLESDLFHAIEQDELYLVYQPQIDILSGEISGAESLMRWKHETKGSIRPDKFIAYAEENGFIVQLGAWGMRQAIKQCESWQIESQALPKIAINISPRQLRHENFIADVEELISQYEIGTTILEFEITESLFISDDRSILNKLHKLNELGISIAIDDFGKGYSSLSYLKKLPVQTLKIDKLFINDICEDSDSTEIVKAIIAMAKSLNKTVIAEGVETIEQLNILKDLGCDRAQGYFISKPQNAEEFVGYTKTEIININEMRSKFNIV